MNLRQRSIERKLAYKQAVHKNDTQKNPEKIVEDAKKKKSVS